MHRRLARRERARRECLSLARRADDRTLAQLEAREQWLAERVDTDPLMAAALTLTRAQLAGTSATAMVTGLTRSRPEPRRRGVLA